MLDGDLQTLVVKERQGHQMPLALRRFKEVSEETSVVVAMQVAVDRILRRYWELGMRAIVPVSVGRLCEILGAKVYGRPSATQQTDLHTPGGQTTRRHLGKLYADQAELAVRIPPALNINTARVSVAHELAHGLIHWRGTYLDTATIRLPSTSEEEALAEYGARLMLLPHRKMETFDHDENAASFVLGQSGEAKVTVHSAMARLGDPDIRPNNVCGAILWRLNAGAAADTPLDQQLTPHWHLCPNAFIPIGKCKAGSNTLVSEVAKGEDFISDSRIEDVRIGNLSGRFRVDAAAWGSVSNRTRWVLSVFRMVH